MNENSTKGVLENAYVSRLEARVAELGDVLREMLDNWNLGTPKRAREALAKGER